AVRCLDDVATYGEVNRRANQLARHLRQRGLGSGDVVALHLDRSVELVVAMLAVQKAGGVYVPLDPVYPANHVAAITRSANARVVLTHDLLDEVAPQLSRLPAENLDLAPDPAAAMYILFTSGSSGQPKGVVVEHRHLASFVHAMRDRMALPEQLSFATVTTFAADLGMTNVYGSLTTGGTLHVVPYALATDPDGLAGYFGRHRIDFMKTVPSHLAALTEAGVLPAIMPRRYLVLAGEAFPWDLADAARAARPGCEIWNHYGPTETTVDVLGYRVGDERPGSTVPIGFAFDRVHAHILDGDLRPVPLGSPGELVIGGASVARGYLSDAGRAAFVELGGGRAYRTGDRVRRLPGGAVEFLGRIDRQVKVRGYRVEPSHVEATLRRHPTVADAVVLVREARLIAYVVADRGTDLGALREHARANLPPYMVPGAFLPIDRLPLTPNGKLDARALPDPN
ncbi:MAG: amino acid adenylation domain-containing protein, partial [Actinomycetes bacterium]